VLGPAAVSICSRRAVAPVHRLVPAAAAGVRPAPVPGGSRGWHIGEHRRVKVQVAGVIRCLGQGQGSVLLVDHRKAGLWLPTGGHVEPGEHPAATVRREVREELGVEAVFSPVTGESPMFVTVTATNSAAGRHTDVSLWFVLTGRTGQPLAPDPREFPAARWWTRAGIGRADPALFEPHLNRMLGKFDHARTTGYGA